MRFDSAVDMYLNGSDRSRPWTQREEEQMLGEQLGEASGTVTGIRVLSAEGADSDEGHRSGRGAAAEPGAIARREEQSEREKVERQARDEDAQESGVTYGCSARALKSTW